MFFVVQGGRTERSRAGGGLFLAAHRDLAFPTREEAEAAATARYGAEPFLIVDAEHPRDAFLQALRSMGSHTARPARTADEDAA